MFRVAIIREKIVNKPGASDSLGSNLHPFFLCRVNANVHIVTFSGTEGSRCDHPYQRTAFYVST